MTKAGLSLLGQARASFRLAVPIIVGQLALIGMNLVATLLLGRIGTEAMAAGALGGAFFFSVAVIANGILSSTGVMVAQADGEGDPRRAAGYAQRAVLLAILLAVPGGALLFFAPAFLSAIGQPPELVALTAQYLQSLAPGMLPYAVVLALRYFLAAIERPLIGTVMAIFGVGVEFIVGHALLSGWLGTPMGVEAVGFSVMAGCFAMMGGMLLYLRYAPHVRAYGLHRRGRALPGQLADLWRIGWPIGVAFGAETLFFMLTTVLAGYFTGAEVAAHSIGYQSITTAFMIAVGLSHATMVRVARAAGEGDLVAVRRIGWAGIGLGIVSMGGTGLGLALGGRWIAAQFLDPTKADAAAVFDFAAPLLVIAALFQLFDGTQAIAAGALRGLKDSRGPMVIGLIAYWPIGMASGALLAFWLDLRLVGLWGGLALGLAVAAVALTVRFHLKSRHLPDLGKG